MKKANQVLTVGMLSFLLGYFNNQINNGGWAVFIIMCLIWSVVFFIDLIDLTE